MGLKLFIFLWISALSTPIFASIHLCNAGIQSKVCKQVKKEEDYVREISPFPQPTAVKVTVNILDILDVNENEQTMTLFIKLRLYWIDKQLSLNKTENDIQMKKFWFIISLDDIGDIWTPDVYVGNAVTNLGSFGDTRGRLTHFWFQTDDQAVLLVEKRIVSFSCKMKFEEFPFDSHKCEMMLYVFVGGSHQVKLNKPTLFVFDSSIGDEISGSKVNKSSEHLDMYSFSFEAMESSELKENGFKYSKVAIKVYFERTEKGRAKIFSSYHATTGTFALLSMISFLIDPSQVPGRLGLLITLCLIMINSYNSVDAPAKRGFSTIEMWFVGTLTPVLFALLEYGLVLALLKYGDLVSGLCEGLRISSKTLMKSIDFVSLILATAYFVCFNVYFWRL